MAEGSERLTPVQAQQFLQEAVLRNYPNPERTGCPGREISTEIAEQSDAPIGDDRWDHILHCSPCYREFLDIRRAIVRQRRRHRFFARALLLLIAVTVAVVMVFWLRSTAFWQRHGP